MVENILSDIICRTFEKAPGRDQCIPWSPVPRPEPQCLLVSFSLHIDFDKEHGYRHLDLLLYGPTRYVQVWTRIRETIIALEDMTDEDDAEPKPGKDYVDTTTPWELQCDHDSCWRDAVRRTIFARRDKLSVIDGFDDWYKVIPVPPEIIEEHKKQRR